MIVIHLNHYNDLDEFNNVILVTENNLLTKISTFSDNFYISTRRLNKIIQMKVLVFVGEMFTSDTYSLVATLNFLKPVMHTCYRLSGDYSTESTSDSGMGIIEIDIDGNIRFKPDKIGTYVVGTVIYLTNDI